MSRHDPHPGQQPQPRPDVPICVVTRNGVVCAKVLTDTNRHCPRNPACDWCSSCVPNREGAQA